MLRLQNTCGLCNRKVAFKMSDLTIVLLGFSFVYFSDCHPQCLDFRPPFENKQTLSFCTEYSDFGCCSYWKDTVVKNRYNSIVDHLRRDGLEGCTQMLKELLCQECSPYAAHIYDAEETQIKRPFPGLCSTFCNTFYSRCSGIVKYITDDQQILSKLSSAHSFCEAVSLQDVDYCYPELLTNKVLNGEISREAITGEGCLCLEPFAERLRNPLLLRAPPDDSDRLFIAEQLGIVYIYYKNGTKEKEPFINISSKVLTTASRGDERGFLGLEFHPQFGANQKFYVYYSIKYNQKSKVRISEFLTLAENPNKADLRSEKRLIEIDQPYWNHNGGEILFGLDGYLYLFVGDGGAGGDPHGYAQNKSVLLGKVLRIDVDSSPDPGLSYAIPRDNPFIRDKEARPEIFAYGIRNIWRCDVDPGDDNGYAAGRIICGDVGQNAFEEIDVIEKGGNYGWNGREGFHCFKENLCGNLGPEVLPIFEYPHKVGKSVTGGHMYRGCMNPNLRGRYIYGDYTNGKIFALDEDKETGTWSSKELTMCGPDVCFNGLTHTYGVHIMSFGKDQDGEIYVITTDVASTIVPKGMVYKIVDPRRRGDPTQCKMYKVDIAEEVEEKKSESVSNRGAIPHANNGWRYTWMPVTSCIMVPALKCYHYFL